MKLFHKVIGPYIIAWAVVLLIFAVAKAEVPLYANDGDTVKFSKTLSVKLHCIDAPELLQTGGIESREFLTNLIAGKDVTIDYQYKGDGTKVKDRFGRRHIANLLYCGVDIGYLMVKEGWAFLDEGCLDPEYISAFENAKKEKKGFWGWYTPPESPKEFRKKIKQVYGGR